MTGIPEPTDIVLTAAQITEWREWRGTLARDDVSISHEALRAELDAFRGFVAEIHDTAELTPFQYGRATSLLAAWVCKP